MKRVFLIILFFAFLAGAFSQSQPLTTNASQVNKINYGDIDRYVWGYANSRAEKSSKQIIDFNAIENWEHLTDPTDVSISDDGKFVAYGIQSHFYGGNSLLDTIVVQSATSEWRQAFPF